MKPSERIINKMVKGDFMEDLLDLRGLQEVIDALHDRIEALENTSPHFQKLKEKQEPKKLAEKLYLTKFSSAPKMDTANGCMSFQEYQVYAEVAIKSVERVIDEYMGGVRRAVDDNLKEFLRNKLL